MSIIAKVGVDAPSERKERLLHGTIRKDFTVPIMAARISKKLMAQKWEVKKAFSRE